MSSVFVCVCLCVGWSGFCVDLCLFVRALLLPVRVPCFLAPDKHEVAGVFTARSLAPYRFWLCVLSGLPVLEFTVIVRSFTLAK